MPLYDIRTYKHWEVGSSESWENVYTAQTIVVGDTAAVALDIIAAERAVSYDWVSFDGYDVVLHAGGPAVLRGLGYIGQGDLDSAGLGGPVPLFNTIRATFFNALGRPEQKYLRLGANADNLENGQWSGEFKDFVDENYTQVLVGNLEYVGPNGEAHTGATTHQPVQMRQLSWGRRTRPGFHRGWVPD